MATMDIFVESRLVRNMLGGLWTRYKQADPVISAGGHLIGLLSVLGVSGAAVMAWASTTWSWYWATFNWAGVAIAFLVSLIVISASFLLIAGAAHKWQSIPRAANYLPKTLRSATTEAPEFRINLLGANIFESTGNSDITGILIDARIWNTGKPSIITEIELTLIVEGNAPILAQFTKMPNRLDLSGQNAGNSVLAERDDLERIVTSAAIGATLVEGKALFYAHVPKLKVLHPNTRFEFSVRDLYRKQTTVSKTMNEWLAPYAIDTRE